VKTISSVFPSSTPARWLIPLGAALALPLLALALAWVSSGFADFRGWWSFLALGLVGAGVLLLGWRLVREEAPPRWLAGLLLGAALLRLAAGVFWFVGLPVAGHGSPGEQKGYVMADAAARDEVAWELASSGKSLTRAMGNTVGYRKADQYGGLLFLSAAVYRYLGGGVHRPLLLVLLAAACSALTVLFGWAFARRAWGPKVAAVTAWGLALYPEAVLLGSSQMREAFLMPLAAAALYGLVRSASMPPASMPPASMPHRQGDVDAAGLHAAGSRSAGINAAHSWPGLAWVLASLLLILPFSPPAAALLVVLLALLALFFNGERVRRSPLQNRRFWLVIALLALLALAGIWLTWRRFAPETISNPLTLVNWWLRESAELQAERARNASGWIQKVFDATPDWMEVPLLLAYGVVQPFLPAALGDIDTRPIWYVISVWRSPGWALLLPFLIYAPLRVLRPVGPIGGRRLAAGLCLVVWFGILAAALRGGSDVWDNPRYRVMWVVMQGALAAWVWVGWREYPDAWLRRAAVSVALVLAWFLPWYLRRYLGLEWPVVDLFKTLGLGLASAALFCFWDWARNHH
jgi:hypothetical protein